MDQIYKTKVRTLLQLVARKYTLPIIELLDANGPMRYTELQDALGTKSTSTLAKVLDDLVDAGLVERRRHHEIPPRVEYEITPRGRELDARLEPLLEWIAGAYTDERTS